MDQKTESASLVGKVFNATYKILRQIGTGGMGAVYEAVNTRLANKRYAVKMLHASIAQDAEVFQRFRREAEIATEIGHPNIVEVHDFDITPDGAPYMVMELLDGEDLAARLQKRGPMPLQAMGQIVAEICSALDAAHGAGIVHRDLKPQNIFLCKKLGRDDFVKIVDFGISKVRHSSSVVTRDHSLMGTPFYMSPEQADGLVQQIDNRTDIFAMGAILWEMLTGRMAFEAPTISGAMYKVVHVDPIEVHLMRPDVPPSVSLVLRRAMAKEKELRYASVVELSHEFANACRGMPPQIMPPPLRGQTASMVPQQPIPRPQTPQPVPTPPRSQGQDAFAATGYVTPPPGQMAPGQSGPIPQPGMGMMPGQPGSYPPGQQVPPGSYPPGQYPQQGQYPPGQYPPGSYPPGQYPPQQGGYPSGGYPQAPPTAFPPQQPGAFPPTAMPPGMMHGGTPPPGMVGTPAPGQMMGPGGSGGMAAPPSTFSQAAGQVATPTSGGKGKGMIIAIAAVVVIGGAGGAYALFGHGGGEKKQIAGGDKIPDAGGKDPTQEIKHPPPPIDAGLPDAHPKVVIPVSDEVTITFAPVYDKAPAKTLTPVITVAGKAITGASYKVKKGTAKIHVDMKVAGYHTGHADFVPDQDKTVSVPLKLDTGGGGGGGKCDRTCRPPSGDDCMCCPICE